ncbi:class I SAM-dependent methyltransferase family protein [Candidatus Bathyarchaeota archaeon]|nr:class I SAM-dependent methyltransferase family protein [Candidatus Bathyarchaeota archaeon]
MDKVYGKVLPGRVNRFKGLDVVGDIAVIKVPEEAEPYRFEVARELLKHLPSVRVVLRQVSPTSGLYRVRGLEWLAGERRTTTVHREHGCIFKVDLAKVYFSPRLLYERLRIAKLVEPGEAVVNMFAGVGCFSIVIAKLKPVSKVYSIDVNPEAYRLMVENIRLNKVEQAVEPILGDSKTVVESRLRGVADRVLMPLPELAYEYLPSAVTCLKTTGGWIHYYDFVKAGKGENPEAKAVQKVSGRLLGLNRPWSIAYSRVVRTVASRTYQVVLDIRIGAHGDMKS